MSLKKFVDDLGRKAIDTLTNASDSPEKIRENFRKLLNDAFNVPSISDFVLGRIGKTASPDEKKQFLELFKTRLEYSYAARFKDYKGVIFTVKDGRLEADGGVVVNTTLQKPGGPTSLVDWKIYKDKQGQLKIYDVTIEGVSMSQTLRTDYSAAFSKNGNDMEKFLKGMSKN